MPASWSSRREQPGPRRSNGTDAARPTHAIGTNGTAGTAGTAARRDLDEDVDGVVLDGASDDTTAGRKHPARAPRELRTIARHGRLRRRPWATVGKSVLAVVSVVVLSVTGLAAVAAANLVADVKPSVHLVGQPQTVPDIGALVGGVNILIAATDTRSGQGGGYGTLADSSGAGLNDVTMLIHLSQDHSHATVVSFPRDLILPIPACPDPSGGSFSAMSAQPLNVTLSYGGLACTVLTIEQLTGLKIPFAGLVDFKGVVAMSNVVGGVPVCIADGGIHDYHTNLNLPDGIVSLKGVQAAEFLRTRYGVGDGSDLGRISNTQVFLSSLVRTVMTPKTLGDPAKIWGIAKAITQNVQLSESMNNLTTLYQMAMAAKDLDFNNIVFVQYPVGDSVDYPGKVVAVQDSAATLMDALQHDQPLQLTGGTGLGAVTSTAAPTPPPPAPSSTPTASKGGSRSGSSPTASAKPTPTATPVALPDDVTGQTAATQTCSKGNN